MFRRMVTLVLEQFQQRCLRFICRIKWQDKVSNVEVLERCGVSSVESQIIRAQIRWVGHVYRMEDSRIPKAIMFSQLALVYSLRSVPRGRPAEPPKTLLINAAPATGFAAQESGSTPTKERIVNVSAILMRWLTTRESIINIDGLENSNHVLSSKPTRLLRLFKLVIGCSCIPHTCLNVFL